jgi:Tol biopolymer transport system component
MKPVSKRWRTCLGGVAWRVTCLAIFFFVPLSSAQYFGQNKVPGPKRNWRVIESRHFDLHFYEEEREVAVEALRIAERAYGRLSRVFNHEIRERVPVILYVSQSEFQETRAVGSLLGEGTGGVTESYKSRVIVPATGSIAQLDHVLTHELVHAFQFDILGRGARATMAQSVRWMPPLWVMEGLAEYFSVPGMDRNTEMWLRDATLQGTLPTVEHLAYFGDIRVYRYGQSLIAYIAEEFGTETVGRWFRSMILRQSVARGTEESLGLTLEKMTEGWTESLRRRYFPTIAQHADPEAIGRRLTHSERSLAFFYVIPAVSPDGTEMVYVSGDGLHSDLHLASAIDGSHARRLIRGYREETFESLRFYTTSVGWSPDGRRIALVAKTRGREVLMIFDVRTKRVEQEFVFGLDEMRSPVWSPDGTQIVFVGLKHGRSDLYLISAEGRNFRALTADCWAAFQPAWCADGRRIAFVTDCGYASASPDPTVSPWKIAILDLASGDLTLLANAGGKSINPQWFPDCRHLLYVTDRTGVSNLFIHDLETGCDYALTDFLTSITGITAAGPAASLSANGRRVVFSMFEGGRWDLLAIDDPLTLIAGSSPWQAPAATIEEDGLGESFAREVAADSLLFVGLVPGGLCDTAAVPESLHSAATVAGSLDSTATLAESLDSTGTEGEPAELDLRTLFAETSVLPESVSVAERAYASHFTVDYARAGGMYATGFGFQAAAGLVLSDMLGDRKILIAADVSGSLEQGDFLLGYLNQGARPIFNVNLYQYWTGYGNSLRPGFVEDYEVRAVRGIGLGLIHPFSHFRRVEFWLDGVYERRYRYFCKVDTEDPLTCDLKEELSQAWYAVPEIAWIYDSAIYGPTGPLSGRRTRLSASAAFGEREFYGFEADHRLYFNIRRRYALALRGVAAADWGRDRTRLIFGGPYSLRGYSDAPLAGNRIAFMNLEFRFPFVEQLFIAWPLPLRFGGIRGALFFDMGAAWDKGAEFRAIHSGRGAGPFRLADIRASAGFGVAINLGITVLRWDLTRRTNLSRWLGGAKGELSFGWEF